MSVVSRSLANAEQRDACYQLIYDAFCTEMGIGDPGGAPFRMIVSASNAQIERGVELVFCFCQPHLLNLYASLGFRPYAPLFEVQGFGVVVPLVLIVSDLPYMKAIRWPLLRYLPKHRQAGTGARIRALLPEEPPVTVSTALDEASWSEAYSLLSQTQGRKGPFDIVKGQDTRPAFVVLEGAVEVRAGEIAVARYQKGEMFGEFAMLLHTGRTADVYGAGERVRLLVPDERTLQRPLASRAELAARFLLNLSRSLALRLLSSPLPSAVGGGTRS